MTIEEIYHLYASCDFQVCTDTRKPAPGSLFICLQGASFDANQFARLALEAGCAYALASDISVCDGLRVFYVPDTLRALQDLALHHRLQMKAKVIGIGGSNGKTTTKELTAVVLSQRYKTIATQGNLNNHIGVPLTLLRIRPDTEMAVVELGTNHPGEIEVLCRIARPDAGIITNIGKEHLEGFGSLEGVAREESELYRFLQINEGIAFVNADDHWLLRMSSRLKHVVHYGFEAANVQPLVRVLHFFPSLKVELAFSDRMLQLESSLAGNHNLSNLLAALCIGMHYGVDAAQAADAIASYQPANNRSQWLQTENNLLWLDAYNANPSSMEAALRSFARWDHPRKVVMLGDMFELGAVAEEEHQHIINLALELGFNQVFLAGELFHQLTHNHAGIKSFLNSMQLQTYLKEHPILDSAILIKGSRGVMMERVADVL
jgi:UDP-N-acetylmuramoyl-tripeptide--D-alanyl-D-alanine ligase